MPKLLKTYYDRFKEHVMPQSNKALAHYKFHARVQCDGEPFENLTDLKLLVQDCTYDGSDKMV